MPTVIDTKALKSAHAAKLAAANKLVADNRNADTGVVPQEIVTQVHALINEADQIKAQIDLGERLGAAEGDLNKLDNKAAHLGWRDSAPSEGNVEFDAPAWREVEVKSTIHPRFDHKVRYHVPLAIERAGEKAYTKAYEPYLRMGDRRLQMEYPSDYKTLTSGTDSSGGFYVPPEYQAELIKRTATLAVVRQLARVAQTSRDVAQWPRVVYNDSTDKDRYTSGVRLTWSGEIPSSASAHRVTESVAGLFQIPVNTAMASWPISNNLLEDAAFDVMGMAMQMLAEAFALGEEDVFLNGTGVSQPMGLLTQVDTNNGPTSVVSGTTSAPYYTYAALLNLDAALPSQYEQNAVFLARKATYSYIRQIVVGSNANIPLWSPGMAEGYMMNKTPDMLLGYAAHKSEFVPVSTGSGNFPLILGDFKGYLILDRVGLSIQRLSELYAETNITLLLGKKRVGGQAIEPYRFRVSKISS